ncbi:MAG TPA: TMEM175 family protein [Ktedonosporobacter sp.]|nr:TMEM175 family protein [Ktedonosporobacter sp.]
MRTYYTRIAGQSLERLAAISDGIFAVGMTLLVLDLHIPVSTTSRPIHTEADLWGAFVSLSPNLLAYFTSFLMLGVFWIGQQTQLNHFTRSDRTLTWIHLIFLLGVSLMPFSTGLLGAFITFRLALVVYWLNILLLGVMLLVSIRYAWRAGLVKEETTAAIRSSLERRIVISQVLYAFGALLCVINNYWSIAVIVLVQLVNFFVRW